MFESSSIELSCGRFAYLATGDTGAPMVVCLHGFPDHAPGWMRVMRPLADAGYRVIAPWMRGYFPSVVDGPYHLDQLCDDVVSLVCALSPGCAAALVGHDWGALVSYAALARAPERFFAGVTMSVPHPLSLLEDIPRDPTQLARSWYMMFFQLPHAPERIVPRHNYAFVDRLWRSWSPDYTLSERDAVELKQCIAQSMPGPIEYYRALTRPPRAVAERIRRARGERISVPTLALHGERDGCIGVRLGADQARYFDGPYRRDTLPDVGHFLQLEAPTLVASKITSWLASHR